ncbi:long-chain-fatty-acid--CoA ligase [Allokutzneria sp. A3M-2-11 16]|uniref:long-chain-fatty-acid--CoA ligase n=1 Tax=Allokutzneria sp. A3M-2-11 16 TaxID=2962043 RepID=UPI0020B66850|nr:long-chain-fatty-acid--CoA ligase [Allokutzneria sp. A3M-2-11 16]MCP3804808.1 long-chain-fatty-acid--CoA ligase [Allokutzneria sp. A3M-2-11 16]
MSPRQLRHFPELRSVAEIPAFHAGMQPNTAAILCAGKVLSYAELDRASSKLARALLAEGVRQGERVAFLGKESVDYYVAFFGCARAGAVLVPINFRLTSHEVGHILRDSGSRVLLVDRDLAEVVRPLLPELPELRVIGLDRLGEWISPYPDTAPSRWADPEQPVVQLYTSGTTGLPKGVVLAQRSFFAIRDALADRGLTWIDWREDDRNLIGIPGFHVGGIWWATQAFAAGVTNIAMPRFDSAEAVRLIHGHGVTTVCVVPSMLRLLLAEPDVDAETFRSVRKVVYGGSPIAEALLREALPVLDCDFAQIYGLTETGNTAVCLPPADHDPRLGRLRAAGRAYPGVQIKIIDPDGAELPPGEVGEVCLRTPARMVEYWRLPEATERTLREGWVHTGDAGHLDADGYLFIQDRLKDMIIVGGENVYPTEIENVLAQHPGVADSAVVGVPDDRFGEAVHAFVARRPGEQVGPRELLSLCTERLAGFKIPRRFEFVERIPRNPSGKILRRELRDPFWSTKDRQVN